MNTIDIRSKCRKLLVSTALCLFSPLLLAQPLEKITVASSIDTMDAVAVGLAQSLGIFKKYGIEASFVKGANGPSMLAAVVGGSADITHVGVSLYFPTIEKGADFKFLMANYDIDYTLVGQKNVAWPNAGKPYPAVIRDLKGKTLGLASRGGATEVMARKMLKDAGMDPDKDVTFIAVGVGPSAAAAFSNKQVDAMVAFPPSDSIIGGANFVRLVDVDTTHQKVYGPNYLFTVFAANSDFVTKRRAVATNFCRAMKEAIAYAQNPKNITPVVNYVSKAMNLNAEQATAVWNGNKGNYNTNLSESRWNEQKNFSKFVPAYDPFVDKTCADIGTGS